MRGPAAVSAVLAGVLLSAGCTPAPPVEVRPAHWDRPTEDLATLTLDPRTVRFVRTADGVAGQLAIGGVFVRHDADGQPDDALGLIVVVEEPLASRFTREQAVLHLDIDGAAFDAGATPRGLIRDGSTRSSFLVDTPRALLEELVDARTVRGRIGSTVGFVLPPENRVIFRDFLARLPAEAFVTASAVGR